MAPNKKKSAPPTDANIRIDLFTRKKLKGAALKRGITLKALLHDLAKQV